MGDIVDRLKTWLLGPEWRVVVTGSWTNAPCDTLVTNIPRVRAHTRVGAASKAMRRFDVLEDYIGKNRDWSSITLRVHQETSHE